MTEQDIKDWLASCTKRIVDEARSKGFPVDDYRIELVLTEEPRDPSQPITATEIIARNATWSGVVTVQQLREAHATMTSLYARCHAQADATEKDWEALWAAQASWTELSQRHLQESMGVPW